MIRLMVSVHCCKVDVVVGGGSVMKDYEICFGVCCLHFPFPSA